MFLWYLFFWYYSNLFVSNSVNTSIMSIVEVKDSVGTFYYVFLCYLLCKCILILEFFNETNLLLFWQ